MKRCARDSWMQKPALDSSMAGPRNRQRPDQAADFPAAFPAVVILPRQIHLPVISSSEPVGIDARQWGRPTDTALLKIAAPRCTALSSTSGGTPITSDGGASWTHDHNGNRTYQPNGVGSYNYTYDDENLIFPRKGGLG